MLGSGGGGGGGARPVGGPCALSLPANRGRVPPTAPARAASGEAGRLSARKPARSGACTFGTVLAAPLWTSELNRHPQTFTTSRAQLQHRPVKYSCVSPQTMSLPHHPTAGGKPEQGSAPHPGCREDPKTNIFLGLAQASRSPVVRGLPEGKDYERISFYLQIQNCIQAGVEQKHRS